MKIAVMGAPYTYESKRFVEEGGKLNHQVRRFKITDLVLEGERPLRFFLNSKDSLEFDAFIFRGITKHIPQVLIFAEYLVKNKKIVIDERLGTGRYITSKFSTIVKLLNADLPVPKTFQPLNHKSAFDVAEKLGYPLIFKRQMGSKGSGVFKIENPDQFSQILKKEKLDNTLIQEYIENNFDVRIFVVGDKVLGGMKRTAPSGDFRSNVAVGGTTEKFNLEKDLIKLSQKATKTAGDDIAGVDVMFDKNNNPYILEVNRSPQFRGFEKTTGINVAGEIIKYLESKKN